MFHSLFGRGAPLLAALSLSALGGCSDPVQPFTPPEDGGGSTRGADAAPVDAASTGVDAAATAGQNATGQDAAANPDATPDYGGADGSVPTPEAGSNDAQVGPGTPSMPGCDPTRVATAVYVGGERVDPQPEQAPYTCATPTGQRAPFNTSVAVTDTGSVLFSPASSTGILRTDDEGATFAGPLNDPPDAADGSWYHPWVWRDDTSGRLFFTAYNSFAGPCALGTGHNYWYSDDDGVSWTEVPEGVGCGSWDWGKIVTGPPATEASRQALAESGYPSLVYFCAGGMVYALGTHHFCYRSTDGGLTFTRTKGDAVDPLRGQIGWPNAGAIAPDGTFYKAHSSGNGVSVVISEDEGDSWRVVQVPDSELASATGLNFLASNVATDDEGNVYVVWVDDRDLLPYLAVSRDRATTWSAPMMVGAPEVRASTNINVAVRGVGNVAIDYYGSPQKEAPAGDGYFESDGRPYNGYLTVTDDIFADKPVFWSTSINDPAEPTLGGVDVNVSEYIGPPVFGPDGSIWVGFLSGENGLLGRLFPLSP